MEVKIQHRKHITLVPTSPLKSALPHLIDCVMFVLGCIMSSTRTLHFSPFERSSFLVSLSQLMAPSSCLVLKPWSYLWYLSLPLTSSIQYISKSCGFSFQNGTQIWPLLTIFTATPWPPSSLAWAVAAFRLPPCPVKSTHRGQNDSCDAVKTEIALSNFPA